MGAIFFYIFIYFLGYYGSIIFNMFTVRPLITNRFLAALVPVVAVAIAHGYMITTRPPPASQDITVESALFTYVIMPVIIVTLGAIYFMWNSRKDEEDERITAEETYADESDTLTETVDSNAGETLSTNKKEDNESDTKSNN